MATKKRKRSPSRTIRPRRRGPYLKAVPPELAPLVKCSAPNTVLVRAETTLARSQREIREECDRVRDILLEKNRAYGDSALNPVRIFSKASAEEQILVRLDDKLSRMVRGESAGEDVPLDFIGYLHLLRIARARVDAAAGIVSWKRVPARKRRRR